MGRRILALVITSVSFYSILAGPPVAFIVNGHFEGLPEDSTVRLSVDGYELGNSTVGKEGRFRIEGVAFEPSYVTLHVGDEVFADLFVEAAEVFVTGSYRNAETIRRHGTRANRNYDEYLLSRSIYFDSIYGLPLTDDLLMEIKNSGDLSVMELIDNNRDNVLGAYFFGRKLVFELSLYQIFRNLELFTPEMRNNVYLLEATMVAERKMEESAADVYISLVSSQEQERPRISPQEKESELMVPDYENQSVVPYEADEALTITEAVADKVVDYSGKDYLLVNLPDTEGRYIPLHEMVGKGKFILVDFWAPWCGPCLYEMPYLKEAYGKYHSMGFEIYGISLNRSEDTWKEAIANYGMEWINVNSFDGWKCQAAVKYGVGGIPSNFLISPDGQIIEQDLRAGKLLDKLAEIYE